MDKNNINDKNSKQKKMFLSILRRSTKIEPQNLNDGINESNENIRSAKNIPKPLKVDHSLLPQINKSLDSCKIAHTDEDPGPSRLIRSASFKENLKSTTYINNNNRLSGQFSLCCSTDNKSLTPPVSVRYDSGRQLSKKNNFDIDIKKTNIESYLIYNEILNEKTNINTLVYDDRSIVATSTRPLEIATATNKTFNNYKVDDEAEIKRVVRPTFKEYQPSIAMTACRSRLRQKLLPPRSEGNSPDMSIQHFSSPNIFDNLSEHSNNRSYSYDYLMHQQGEHRPGSTDSLARQALMAVQVLHLIPTEKARERNFLQGRVASISLLGSHELQRTLPNKEIKIFVGTWNMNGQSPPKEMNDFVLPTGIEHVPDVVAVGTQESSSERFEWEVILQETLGPSHILLHSAYLGTLHLAVFIRRDLIWYCSVPEDDSFSVRPGTAFRTKGAVAISFSLFGTSMLFVSSHLTAHQQKVKERVQDIKRIIQSLDLPRNLNMRHKNRDVTQNFDSVFWCGDLNFRLAEPREKLLKWIESTKFPLPSHLPHGYMHTDQLKSVLADGAAFKGFKEANITFPPTYKYDPGTQHFDTSSKQRAPAYTDRILYKYKNHPHILRRGSAGVSNTHLSVECLAYDSVPSIISSDHKPVWALFRNAIRPGIDSIPLAAGLFNREVYLEGIKRRINSCNSSASAVCSIQ